MWILKRKLQKKDLKTSRKWTKDMDPGEQESRGGGGRGSRVGGEGGRGVGAEEEWEKDKTKLKKE